MKEDKIVKEQKKEVHKKLKKYIDTKHHRLGFSKDYLDWSFNIEDDAVFITYYFDLDPELGIYIDNMRVLKLFTSYDSDVLFNPREKDLLYEATVQLFFSQLLTKEIDNV